MKKEKKPLKISCWVAISEDNEFDVGSTRKEAKKLKDDFKNFDIETKIKKAILIIK